MKAIYQYRLRSTGHSSARYAPCEVCKRHAPEVYIQAEMRFISWTDGTEHHEGWTYHECRPHTFGHKHCLVKLQHRKDAHA